MIIDFNRYNGGGSGSGVTPEQVQQEIQSALTPYWESGETKDYVDEAVSGLATEQYVQDALSGIDLSNYYTSAQTDTAIANAVSGLATEQYVQDALSGVDLTNYWDSAATEEAISAATSGKADAVNIQQNTSLMQFPAWNNQGIITGQIARGYNPTTTINGKVKRYIDVSGNGDVPPIWAPQSAGTAGDILVSTGNGVPVWSAVTMPDMAAYTPTSGFSTINGSAITDGGNLVIQGGGSNSNILSAITTQAEYEAISGYVKTGDLIQVWGVDLNGDNNPEYGLFGATVGEEEYEGVVRKSITWTRKDNMNSVYWSGEDYPWMPQNDVQPIELGQNGFLISPDMTAEDDAYNGIGFNEDGKPVITHFAPEYDDETGEVTGITREDTPIGADMSAYYTSAQTEDAISAATADFITSADTADMVTSTSVSTIWRGTQVQYDAIAVKDPNTFYIILLN